MSRRGKNSTPPPYRRQKYLCSAGELRFYKKLHEAVGDEFEAHMQVSVAAVLRVPAEEWERWGVLVAPMRFDFVLVKRGTSFAAAAVELDDKTHLLPGRRKRDAFLNEACRRAEFPLIRFKAARAVIAAPRSQPECPFEGRSSILSNAIRSLLRQPRSVTSRRHEARKVLAARTGFDETAWTS